VDMHIDSNRIRSERELRAWSQEQLAEVAGLSLRTVQRVEASGAASYETARAIAAVFELEVVALRQETVAIPRAHNRRLRYFGFAATLLLALSVFFVRDARAGDVALDVGLWLNRERLSQSQMVTAEGKSAEIRLEGQVRVFVSPVVTKDGAILLSIRLEEPSGTRWVEIGEPKIMVLDGNQGTVKVTSPKGNVFEITIRPRRI